MATLYVNPDHASSSDAGNYAAAQNSSTPLKTINRAVELAQLNDTINVLHAAAANPSDPNDASVYAVLNDDTFSGTTFAHKDASGGRITIQGVAVGGQAPKWLGLNTRNLINWKIDGFQFGYDLDSGDDYNTTSTFIGLEDCLFSNNEYTAGVANVLGFAGTSRWEACEVTSKYSASPGSFMEGAGIRVLGYYDSDNQAGADDWIEVVGCNFHTIQGEDSLQLLCASTYGNALVEDCTFEDHVQAAVPNSPHTDAIQTTGIKSLVVRRCTFGVEVLVPSMIIGSDGLIDTLVLENNLFVGQENGGFSTQFGGGVNNVTIRHNTWVRSVFGGLRVYRQTTGIGANAFGLVSVDISNNIIDSFLTDSNVTVGWDETSQHHNVISSGQITSGDFEAFPELGDSVDTPWELSNSPTDSAGIDDAAVSDILTDRLGRPRKGSAPDCGCHESDPTVPVVAYSRAPFLVDRDPGSGETGVSADASVTATFYPKPGESLNPVTVDTSAAYVTDSADQTIPAVVTLSALDGGGLQTITINLKLSVAPDEAEGSLFPLVLYTVHLTGAILDTEGSALTATSWSFRVVGPAGPAISAPVEGSLSFTLGTDPRFHVGQTIYLWRGGGGQLPFSTTPVASTTVAADSTTTFTGLDSGTEYLAGFVVSGPFISFRT